MLYWWLCALAIGVSVWWLDAHPPIDWPEPICVAEGGQGERYYMKCREVANWYEGRAQ